MNMNYDEKLKILIIGDSTVGKTSILTRFCKNEFSWNYLATIGIDFFSKDIELTNPNKLIRIKIWDTAGQERFKSLSKSYFRNADGIIIVFDVSKKDSFENLQFWIDSIHNNLGKTNNINNNNDNEDNVNVIIIGNKIDLIREVNKEEGLKYSKESGFKYYETSALTGENIENSFLEFIKDILDRNKKKENKKKGIKLNNNNNLINKNNDDENWCYC